MKYLFVAVVAFLLGTGYSKNDLINGQGDPGEYYMFFEIWQGSDSSFFKKGDIELSGVIKGVNLKTNETRTTENVYF